MKRLIFILALLATPAWATQYYVDNCVTVGSDSNNGTSTETPWLTLAHAISSTTTSDHVSLQGGCTWREAPVLTQGGTSGTPFIWDSYGTGQGGVYTEPAGAFTATAEVGNMTEWTSVTAAGTSNVTADAAALYHGSYGFDQVSDGTNFAYAVKSLSAVSTLWLRYYLFVPTTFSEPATFDYTYLSSLNNSGTILQHCYLQEQGSAALYQVHCQLNYGTFSNFGTSSFAPGTWHRIDVEYVAGTGVAGFQFWFDGTSEGSIFTQTGTTQVNQLWLGAISQNAPTAAAHLYFDTVKVATSSTVATNNALTINNLTYINLNNLNIGYSGDVGVYLEGGASHINVTNSTISNVDANTFKACVFQNGANNITYSGNTILNCEDGIAVSGYGSVANSAVSITGNSMTNFGRHGIQVAPAGGTAPTTTTVNNNDISFGALWVNDSVGLLIDGAGSGNSASYNRSYNHGTAVTEGEDYDADLLSSGDTFAYNLGWGSNNGCIILSGTGHFIYGNSCYNNNAFAGGSSDGELSLYTSASSVTAKNNIFYASSGQPVLSVQSGSTTGNVFNYNDWFGGSATPFSWNGTSYNFANYKTAASQDANSLNVDPKYTSTVTPTLTLQSTSPTLNSGTNLGNTFALGLNPISSWPSAVVLSAQPPAWDMGAYLYPNGVSPFWFSTP